MFLKRYLKLDNFSRMSEEERFLAKTMAVTLDIELRRMDLTTDEQRFRELIKLSDIDELKKFLAISDRICTTKLYDKTVQQAMANNNKAIVALLSEMKTYQASTMTLKLAASLGYRQEFNVLLRNRTRMNQDSEISTLLIAALESENIESIEKLQKLRESNALGLFDETDAKNKRQSAILRIQSIRAEELSASHNSLRNAHNRLNLYKIIANPLYIILYEVDPIDAAIETSNQLKTLGHRFPANKNEFSKISLSCKQLPVDLLDCCEDDEEVAILLNSGSTNENILCRRGRLWNMMRAKLTEFVTHPNCQYWLYSKWCGEMLVFWENYSFTHKCIHILKHSLLFPVYSIWYAIAPPPPEKRIPMNYFIYSLSAYCCFLLLLLYGVFYDKTHDVNAVFTAPDHVVAVWVVTSFLHTIVDLYLVPYPSYWKSWWTKYDLFTLLLFLVAGISNFLASTNLKLYVSVSYFLLVAEGVYAIAITTSFIKILHWFHTTSRLGPVIISFSRMTNVILKLLIVFVVVLFSFSFGMFRLFRYFRVESGESNTSTNTTVGSTVSVEDEPAVFTSYKSTLKVLFWVIFGYGEPTNIEIPSSRGWNNSEDESVIQMKQNFIMVIGYVMWAAFHVTFVIVLLNMLIALMTTSYEIITKNSDSNWKFARTRLWMYYMEKHNIVPPPFNVLHYVCALCRYLYRIVTHKTSKSGQNSCDNNKHQNLPIEAKKKYQETLSTLIDRYENKRFEHSVLTDQWHSERASYVEARKRLLDERINAEITQL